MIKLRIGFVLLVTWAGSEAASAKDARLERVDVLFREWIGPDEPGCSLGVVRDGKLLYQESYGMADLEHDVPLSSRSVFRTASVGKQFTAFALLLAEQQGKLSLDDDVRKYLPELPETPKMVTLRHLVLHTSGIRDYLVLMSLAGKRDEDFYTERDVLEALSRQENVNFPAGSEYLYSNSGYFLLSQVILRATGSTLREFAAKHLFGPLGMESTHYHDDFRGVVKGRAEGYRPRAGGGFEVHRTTLNMVGDGGVFTSIEDLLHWDRNFDSGKVGGRSLARSRLETGRLTDGTEQTYAYGLVISSHRGRRTVSHGGAFVGYRTAMVRFPDDELSVYLLCNRADAEPSKLALQVADLFFGESAEEGEASPGPPLVGADDLRRLAGTYFSAETGEIFEIALRNGSLVLEEDETKLVPRSPTDFLAEGGGVSIRFTPHEESVVATSRSPGQRDFSFRRVSPVQPTLEDLVDYIGLYRCRELDVTYRVELGAERRLVLSGPAEASALTPAFEDGFRWSWGSVVFERAPDRKVRRFRLAAGRARNFVFERR